MRIRRPDQMVSAALLAFGFIVLVVLAVVDGGPLGWLFVVLFAVVGLWSWPGRRGRHTAHDDALAAAGDDGVVVYWRPG